MRLFIAIDLNKELKDKIKNIEDELKKLDLPIKFVEPENLHFTLKFLGEVSEERVKEIEKTVSEVLKDFKPFKVFIQDFGYFGSPNYIRTLWLGLKEGGKEIIEISEKLDEVLSYIRKNEHEPKPHLTIGRVKSNKNKEILLKEIEKLKNVKIGEFYVNKIKLKKSVLTKKGPIYSDLKVFELSEK